MQGEKGTHHEVNKFAYSQNVFCVIDSNDKEQGSVAPVDNFEVLVVEEGAHILTP